MKHSKAHTMKKNMGSADRVSRFSAAIIIAGLYLSNLVTGTTAVMLAALAVIFAAARFAGFNPLYVPLRISTQKRT